jgi:hypothetical protein
MIGEVTVDRPIQWHRERLIALPQASGALGLALLTCKVR